MSHFLRPYFIKIIENVAVVLLFMVVEEAVVGVSFTVLDLLCHGSDLNFLLSLHLIDMLVELFHLLAENLRAHIVLMDRRHGALIVGETIGILTNVVQ